MVSRAVDEAEPLGNIMWAAGLLSTTFRKAFLDQTLSDYVYSFVILNCDTAILACRFFIKFFLIFLCALILYVSVVRTFLTVAGLQLALESYGFILCDLNLGKEGMCLDLRDNGM